METGSFMYSINNICKVSEGLNSVETSVLKYIVTGTFAVSEGLNSVETQKERKR